MIILRYGYPFERFHYETDDGFILSIFRISGGKGSRPEDIYKKQKPVVLLWHGMACSADAFVC